MVYNQLTGSTHLLEGMGAYLFELLAVRAMPRIDLVNAIVGLTDVDGHECATIVDNLLTEYQKLGLLTVTENITA